jgi:hypothetical protein
VPDEVVAQIRNELNPVPLRGLIKRFVLEERVTVLDGRSWRCYSLTFVVF